MSSFTYSQLVQALQDWPEDDNPDFVANIPRIISLAETRLARDLNLELFDRTSDLQTTIGSRLLNRPSDWVVTRTVSLIANGELVTLTRKTYDWCIGFEPDETIQGTPRFFAEFNDTQWLLVDTPDQEYDVRARYVARPTGLAPGNPTTYFSTQHGDLLFAACLIEVEQYIKGDERLPAMKEKYGELLPVARLECRDLIRADYEPIKAAARSV